MASSSSATPSSTSPRSSRACPSPSRPRVARSMIARSSAGSRGGSPERSLASASATARPKQSSAVSASRLPRAISPRGSSRYPCSTASGWSASSRAARDSQPFARAGSPPCASTVPSQNADLAARRGSPSSRCVSMATSRARWWRSLRPIRWAASARWSSSTPDSVPASAAGARLSTTDDQLGASRSGPPGEPVGANPSPVVGGTVARMRPAQRGGQRTPTRSA